MKTYYSDWKSKTTVYWLISCSDVLFKKFDLTVQMGKNCAHWQGNSHTTSCFYIILKIHRFYHEDLWRPFKLFSLNHCFRYFGSSGPVYVKFIIIHNKWNMLFWKTKRHGIWKVNGKFSSIKINKNRYIYVCRNTEWKLSAEKQNRTFIVLTML